MPFVSATKSESIGLDLFELLGIVSTSVISEGCVTFPGSVISASLASRLAITVGKERGEGRGEGRGM